MPFPPRLSVHLNPLAGAAAIAIALALGLSAPQVALAAGITVTTTDDVVADDGVCSLREAVYNSNTDSQQFAGAGECAAGSGPDTIMLPAGRFALGPSGHLQMSKSTAIVGAGTGATTIVGPAGDYTLYAYPYGGLTPENPKQALTASRVYTFADLTVIGGDYGIYVYDYDSDTFIERVDVQGATQYGVYVYGTSLRIGQSRIHHNTYSGLYVSNAETQISLSQIDHNSSYGAYFYGHVNMTQTLVTANGGDGMRASYQGASIVNSAFSANAGNGLNVQNNVAITNSTITANGGKGIYDDNYATGLANTIIAGNATGNCDANGVISSRGHNLSSDASCPGLTGAGDLINTNPLFGPLTVFAPNGMPVYPLLPGSPALDAGANCPADDMRGAVRPFGAACDIGAFELTDVIASLSGAVYNDADNNGARAITETGIAGVPVRLTGGNFTLTAQTDIS
ncbi:MAG: choice-of-anchor Q domain-containing protein, partial [Thermoflexales bacterium]